MPPANYAQFNTNAKYQRESDELKVWVDAKFRHPTNDLPQFVMRKGR